MRPQRKPSGQYTRDRAKRIVRRDGPVCHLCGGEIDLERKAPDPLSLEIDHVIPFRLGGAEVDRDPFCAPSHRRCNRRKGDRLVPSRTHQHVIDQWLRAHPEHSMATMPCEAGRWKAGNLYTGGKGEDFDPTLDTELTPGSLPCATHPGKWLRKDQKACASVPW